MNDFQVSRQTPAATPGRVGQGTAVEQSRAMTEVQAAVMVAQQLPRVQAVAMSRMRESCTNPALAKRAFYAFPRGTQTVSGPTIKLAKELARCWGNVQYGLNELRRDDEYGQSEMQAWAWDLETNNRVSTTFIVQHVRTARGKTDRLTDARDVYEKNANEGNRRMREMIFSVLPGWYVDEAVDACNATLKHGGGVPLAKRVEQAMAAFHKLGITRDQLEQKRDRLVDQWTDMDLAQLEILYRSLELGELTVEKAFPPARVTAEDLTGPVVQPDPDSFSPVEDWPRVAQPGEGS